MDFSAPYNGNFDKTLDFSMLLSNDFKFGHKFKHLEVDRTIEDGSLNVVKKITRVIMIFYANLQYLSVLLQKLRKIILFICSNHNVNQSVVQKIYLSQILFENI